MTKQTRNNTRFTITLPPDTTEGVSILKQEFGVDIVSHVFDKAIRDSLSNLNYSHRQKRTDTLKLEIISNGRTIPMHSHEANLFFECPDSGEYIIRVTNDSMYKQLAVISVDGLNIVNGEEASFDSPGYIINPFSYYDIKGWHRTDKEMAAFTFESTSNSYSSKMGKGKKNVGVVGLAVFEEKRDWGWWNKTIVNTPFESDQLRRETITCNSDGDYPVATTIFAASASAASESGGMLTANAASEAINPSNLTSRRQKMSGTLSRRITKETSKPKSVGTGYGQIKEANTKKVFFDREDAPSYVLSYRYATRPTLIKWGVLQPEIPGSIAPNPFPGEVSAKAPPGWKG